MLRAGELLQKDKLTEKDIEFIEKDINLYFKMNPYDRDIIQKMYNVLIIKAADVFNAKNNNYQVVEQIIGFNPSNVFKAQEDSFLLKQQHGQEYLLSGNKVQALNCFEYAYVLSNTSLGSILIMEKIIICHKYLEQYDEAVLLLDEIEDELEFSLFLYEMRAFSRLSSEKFNTVKDLAIVKEDIKSMKSRFSTIPNEKDLKAYNTLRNILGKKLINHQDQSWRNDPQLVEIANDLIEK